MVFRKEGYQDVVCELSSERRRKLDHPRHPRRVAPVIIDAATGDWSGIGEDACHVGLPEDPADPESDAAKPATENGWVTFR